MVALIMAGSAFGNTPLAMRGTATALPFWLGTNLYGTVWTGFAANDHSADWWWYDKKHWRKTFKDYEDAHLNTLVYWHPHPYVGFVEMTKFPEAGYLTPQEIVRQIEMFRWITAEGRKHGVSIYFLTWNVCLPPGFCKAHALDEFGADTELAREYTRYAVAQLFRTYPDLGGLITIAGESPPGCADFVLNSIVPGLKDSVTADSPRKTLPTFIQWNWCIYPEDMKRILDAYPGKKYALHYLQYEQFFKPMADPRILMTSRALGDMKVLAMGGPSTATGWLYWGDPFFIQKTMQDLARKNGAGILFSGTDSFSFLAERWVAREAFERYSWNPGVKDSAAYWERRIAERYGSSEIAEPLLKAMIASSNIMPRFMALLHSQTDHYQPQCGLPLVNYLEMPTLSTYVFENHESIDEKGRLTPNMGLTWPNPDWGEKVLSIREYVRSLQAGCSPEKKYSTPPAIASEIEDLSESSLERIAQVKSKAGSAKARQQELANTLKLIEMNSYLGLHYAEKIRAGIAWESWRLGLDGSRPETVLERLDKSIEYWCKFSDLESEIWSQPMDFWQSRVPIEPPWDHLDIWNGYAQVKIHLRDMIPIFKRERELIAAQLERPLTSARLPLFPELDVPLEKAELAAAFDFESQWPAELVIRQSDPEIVRVTDETDQTIEGKRALFCDTRASEQEWNLCLQTDPTRLKLRAGGKYIVEFDYKIIAVGPGKSTPFAVAARTDTGGYAKDIGTYRFWGGRAGQVGHKIITLVPKDYEDYYLFFSIHGKAAIVLDNVEIKRIPTE